MQEEVRLDYNAYEKSYHLTIKDRYWSTRINVTDVHNITKAAEYAGISLKEIAKVVARLGDGKE